MSKYSATATPTAAAVLHVPPAALSDLIAAHDRAVTDVGNLLDRIAAAGRIPQSWTRDPVAQDIAVRFNSYAMDSTDSAYNCLLLYRGELKRVADTLRTMHAAYQAGEDANVSTMRAL